MNYIRLLWRKAYLGVLIVLLCACLGSIRGAWKENGEYYIGVTEADLESREEPGVGAPEMIGIMALAGEQNRWLNFNYAAHYAGRGVVCYCILMAAYLPLYHCRPFTFLRAVLGREDSAWHETESAGTPNGV